MEKYKYFKPELFPSEEHLWVNDPEVCKKVDNFLEAVFSLPAVQ